MRSIKRDIGGIYPGVNVDERPDPEVWGEQSDERPIEWQAVAGLLLIAIAFYGAFELLHGAYALAVSLLH